MVTSAGERFCEPRRKLVLAFGVGITHSRISYCILDPGVVPEIREVTRFPAHENIPGASKIPTIIYYDRDGKLKAVGAEAMREGIYEQVEDEGWVKAEWFVPHLWSNIAPGASHQVINDLPSLPPGKTVVDVFADFLAYLYKCAAAYIKDTYANGAALWGLVEGQIEFVLSYRNGGEGVPDDIRKAAIRAGLVSDTPPGHARLSFVTEGEASLRYAIQNGLAKAATQIGDGVVIVDAGGGTIDVSSYRNASKDTFEEVAVPQCYFNGSVFVSVYAREFLSNFLEDSPYLDDLDHIIRCFDRTTKLRFRNGKDVQYINFGLMTDNDPAYNICYGQLKLDGSDVALFFEKSIECIVQAVISQRDTVLKTISHVVLVGGFSASDWVYSQVKEALTPLGLHVIRPDNHVDKAVSDGAILFYLDRYMRSHAAKVTYGIPPRSRACGPDLGFMARMSASSSRLLKDPLAGFVIGNQNCLAPRRVPRSLSNPTSASQPALSAQLPAQLLSAVSKGKGKAKEVIDVIEISDADDDALATTAPSVSPRPQVQYLRGQQRAVAALASTSTQVPAVRGATPPSVQVIEPASPQPTPVAAAAPAPAPSPPPELTRGQHIAQAIVRITEVLPHVEPEYLLCRVNTYVDEMGERTADHVLDTLFEIEAAGGDASLPEPPKGPIAEVMPANVVLTQGQLIAQAIADVTEILPDVDPDHLLAQVSRYVDEMGEGTAEHVLDILFVAEAAGGGGYPRIVKEAVSPQRALAQPEPVLREPVREAADPNDFECGCCFSEYPFAERVQCPDAHLFCSNCILQYAATQLGEHNPLFVCMHSSDCKLPFLESELRRVLTPTLMTLHSRLTAQRAVAAAGLEGLEECPFCDWKCIIDAPIELDRQFICGNEEGGCGIVSCRECKKRYHPQNTCEEMDEDKVLNRQHAIEEAMTRALMRNCPNPNCKKAFVKEDGCNKMTCSHCRTISCYECRQIIAGYEHFNVMPGAQAHTVIAGRCKLFDDVQQ